MCSVEKRLTAYALGLLACCSFQMMLIVSSKFRPETLTEKRIFEKLYDIAAATTDSQLGTNVSSGPDRGESTKNEPMDLSPFDSYTVPRVGHLCAPQEGVIISNTLGRLGNNLFEVSLAHRLAEELCWNVLYRPMWQGEIPSPRAGECFPNAHFPKDPRALNISVALQKKLNLDPVRWQKFSVYEGNEQFIDWITELEQRHLATRLMTIRDGHLLDFSGDSISQLKAPILNEKSSLSLISLESFFINYDWMADYSDKIRDWFQVKDSCCLNLPPENAIVVHVRFDQQDNDSAFSNVKPNVFSHILGHYNYTSTRPIWIVCQPSSVFSKYVQSIVNAIPSKSITIITGHDQYDAFCTLTKAKTLVLSSGSTFSQMAALLASPDTTVHYALTTLERPIVTIKVPNWKYHLLEESLDRVKEFDIEHGRFTVPEGP